MTQKNIILLGATGSIGTSTLNLIRKRREKFKLIGVSTYEKTDKLKLISTSETENYEFLDFYSKILKHFFLSRLFFQCHF